MLGQALGSVERLDGCAYDLGGLGVGAVEEVTGMGVKRQGELDQNMVKCHGLSIL